MIPGSLSIRYGGASADRTITNYAPDDVEYAKLVELSGDATAVEVKFTDKARLGKYVVEGDTKKNGTFTVTITLIDESTQSAIVIDEANTNPNDVEFQAGNATPYDPDGVKAPGLVIAWTLQNGAEVGTITLVNEDGDDVDMRTVFNYEYTDGNNYATFWNKADTPAGKYTYTITGTNGEKAQYTFEVVESSKYILGGTGWAGAKAAASPTGDGRIQMLLSRDTGALTEDSTYLTVEELEALDLKNSQVKVKVKSGDSWTIQSVTKIEIEDYDMNHTSGDFYGNGFGFIRVYCESGLTSAENGNDNVVITIKSAATNNQMVGIPVAVSGIS